MHSKEHVLIAGQRPAKHLFAHARSRQLRLPPLAIVSWMVVVLLANVVFAQQPREYPLMLRDQLTVANEALMPAPAGWGIPLIGVRNVARQHLATIVFYNDALHAFSEISLPQTIINDVIPSVGSGAPLIVLAARQESFWVLPVDARRTIGAGVMLEPGEHGLTPVAGSAVFSGISLPSRSQPDTLLILRFSFFDQSLRHVLAAYTLRGAAVWQVLIGAAAVDASVIADPDDPHASMVLFATEAAPHATGDTVRFSAKKAYIGLLSDSGKLQWVRPYDGGGTATWCIPLPARGVVQCIVRYGDSAEIVTLDMRDGRVRHFAPITGIVVPRTLYAVGAEVAIAVEPNLIALFDTSLRAVGRVTIPHTIDSNATMIPVSGADGHYLLFSSSGTEVLNTGFAIAGITDSGMLRMSGLTRFSGMPVQENLIIAATQRGSALRMIAPNRFWWWYRYRIAAAVIVTFVLLGIGVSVAGRRYLFYRTYYNQLVRGSITTGVVALNRQMRVIHINNAAREQLHIAPYIPLQRHFTEYIAGAQFADILNSVRDCIQTRTTQEKIVALQAGSQPRTLLSRARPTLTRNGILAGCLLQLEDITRTIERERMMSWASVAHHVAHEMKTPIGTVLLNAQHVLKSEEELPERAKKYFHRIVTQAERLSDILQNFLSIARVSAMRFAPIDIVHLLQSISADYAELLPAHITITCTVGHLAGTSFSIDEQQFTTALRNILDNAVHAITPNIGSISIALDEYPIPPNGAVSISIRDSGKGMTDECRARMFEPFYTETPGGSGIGMVIVRRIVEEHKGFIEVESTLGVGTDVRIIIPRIEE